jgi:hypothetical protein
MKRRQNEIRQDIYQKTQNLAKLSLAMPLQALTMMAMIFGILLLAAIWVTDFKLIVLQV